jgi:sugar phosphate isomerase/epimerase
MATALVPSLRGVSRRRFFEASLAATGAAVLFGAAEGAAAPKPKRKDSLKLGLASYTFRKFDLDKTLAMTRRVGLDYICLKSFHLPLDAKPEQIAAVAAKAKQAGLTLYSGGVINLQKQAEIDQAFDYAKAAGMTLIIGAPIAATLPAVDKKIRESGIAVAIHNHGPGDRNFPTPQSVYEKVKDFDPRLGLCIDIGHTVRYGVDLLDATRKCADRLLDVHIKDVTAADPKGQGVQVGRGVIDIPAFLRTLLEIKYAGVVSFEYEEQPDDPLPGLAESVGYTRGVLSAL